ncbi:MAG: VOC family protein [Bacillota bacterium]|jgi:methylmalonyl-CoA/ethylmalonyl-CoA epimerase
MEEETKIVPSERIMLSGIAHVCIVVRDVEKTARTYSSLFGVGPFTIRTTHTPPSRGAVHGEPAGYTLKFGYAQAGPIVLELVETVEGDTIYREFIDEHGEGIHHIGFPAPAPFRRELARWEENGIEPLQTNERDDPRYGWAYMDTQQTAGCILEIVCDPPGGWWNSVSLARDLRGPLGED